MLLCCVLLDLIERQINVCVIAIGCFRAKTPGPELDYAGAPFNDVCSERQWQQRLSDIAAILHCFPLQSTVCDLVLNEPWD